MKPTLHFASQDYRPHDAFEAYRELYSGGSDVQTAGSDFQARLTAFRFGPMVMFERWLNDVTHERTYSRIRRDGFEHYVIQLNLGGTFRIATPDRRLDVQQGEVVLLDAARPYVNTSKDAHILTVSVAREIVERAHPDKPDLHGHVLSSPAHLLVGDFLMSIRHRMPEIDEEAAPPMIEALSHLLGMSGRPDTVTRSLPDADKLGAARRVVEAQLHLRDLSPEAVARNIGVSRSRLYEIFKPYGGVNAYIQDRRVRRLRSLLAQPRDLRPMAEMMYACGFASESHASRTFRNKFGEPPGEFRRRQLGGPAMPEQELLSDGDVIRDWVTRLNLGMRLGSA